MKNLLLFPLLFILSSLFVSCGDDDDNIIMPDEMTISPVSGIYDESGNIVYQYFYNPDGTIARLNLVSSTGNISRTIKWEVISDNEYIKDTYIYTSNGTKVYSDRYKKTSNGAIIKTRFDRTTNDVVYVQKQLFGPCGDTAVYDIDANGNETLLLRREYSSDCLTETTTKPNSGERDIIVYDGKTWYNNSVYSQKLYEGVYVEKGNPITIVKEDANGQIIKSATNTYEYNSDGFVTKITSVAANGNVTVQTVKY